MDSDKTVRSHLSSLLEGGNAHIKFEDVVKDFPISEINSNFPNVPYSPWGLVEHMRIAQWDILDFIRNPNYKEMEWPKDYWPAKGKKATKKDWETSIAIFKKDSKELQDMVNNSKTDLYSKIPHGTGQTLFREVLLVADHNAYHLGEFVLLKRAMGLWTEKQK